MAHHHSQPHTDCGHHHPHGVSLAGDGNRAYVVGIVLNLGFVVAEASFGLISGSLALLADAGHNLGDVLGLLLAGGASLLARRRPTTRHTYGWGRSTILAALGNAGLLLVAVGGIAWEALHRLNAPSPVTSTVVIWVALGGVLVNGITALFFNGHGHDLNQRGAFLHMVGDAAVSAGVAASGIAMHFTGWTWLDPVVSLLIALAILLSTWRLLRESLALALDAVPAQVDAVEVKAWLAQQPGVTGVHDLHIWAMSTTETALTVHLIKPDAADDENLIAHISTDLAAHYGIGHVTVQIEREGVRCASGTAC